MTTLATLAALALVAVTLAAYDYSIAAYHWAARYSARLSFGFFIVAYSVSSWHRLWPSGWSLALLRNRRAIGLSFAGAHTVHLGALTAFAAISDRKPPLSNLIPGGLGYALMLAMAVTSNDRAVRAMRQWWKRLHRVGIHYLWFIFAFTFFAHMRTNDIVWGPIFLALALAAMGLRIVSARSRVIADEAASPVILTDA